MSFLKLLLPPTCGALLTFALAGHQLFSTESLQKATIPWDISITTIDEKPSTLDPWKGQVLLIVNTATGCGLSYQMDDLEKLYQKFHNQGFSILAFPSNDFLGQEPGTNQEIKEACSLRYKLSLPLFAKIHVRGSEISPLYAWLTNSSLHSKLGGSIFWNYTKFLIDREGHLVARFSPLVSPMSDQVIKDIEQCLQAPQPTQVSQDDPNSVPEKSEQS